MKRLILTIGLTLTLAVPAAAQSYRQRMDRLFNNPIPSVPTLGDIMQRRRQREQNLLNYRPSPRPRYLDPRDYTRDFHRPEWDAETERRSRILDRNYYMITGCHMYNRACLNELRSLGR